MRWADDVGGISFNGRGVVYSTGDLTLSKEVFAREKGITVELWIESKVAPAGTFWRIAQFFSLYSDEKYTPLLLAQWRSHLIIRSRHADSKGFGEIGLRNAIPVGERLFITITSGDAGTRVYFDGRLAEFHPNRNIFAGGVGVPNKIILGNSPSGKNLWRGDFHGLAVYDRLLSADRVLLSYRSWLKDANPILKAGEEPVALYLFDEAEGVSVHNRAGTGPDLFIPKRFKVLQRSILVAPWSNFRLNRSFVKDLIINIAGFIPLGLFFSALLVDSFMVSRRKTYLITILFGGALSLAVELAQVYIPVRESSMSDLIFNVSGTFIGIVLFELVFRLSAGREKAL